MPSLDDQEIEIAKINLASTTGDIYSVRIRINDTRKYEILIYDEYETNFSEYQDEFHEIPNQGELFDLLLDMYGSGEPMPHLLNIIDFHEFKSINEITQFIQFDSNIYPNLNELFRDYLVKNGYN